MSAYRCPSCGSTDPWLYVRCQRTGCPDGHDPRPLPVSDELVRLRTENERLAAERDKWKTRWEKQNDAFEVQEQAIAVLRAERDRAEAAEAKCERLTVEQADEIVQKCAEFAKRIIISDARTKLPKGEKNRTPEELAALVYNSLINTKSRGNVALGGSKADA